jgi:hypothetical protein
MMFTKTSDYIPDPHKRTLLESEFKKSGRDYILKL